MKSLLLKLHAGVLKFPYHYLSFRLGKKISFYASIILMFAFLSNTTAQTRLGLHFTQEELNIWKKRAAVGPYKSKGYESINSPGDWDRIMANANTFVKNPSAERWKGISRNSCVTLNDKNYDPSALGKKLRDAAFAYLVTGEDNYKNAVRNELLSQVNEPYTNFAIRSRWCDGTLNDMPPAYPIASWLTRLLFAYDYIKSSLSSSDKQKLDKWFYDAAVYFQRNVDLNLKEYFENRSGENYNLSDYSYDLNASLGKTIYYGGPKTSSIGRSYNNRRSAQVKFFTLVGIHQNNSSLEHSGKRFVKEFLMYSTYPDGMIAEFQRWGEDFSDQGWSYSSHVVADVVDIADHFARTGDKEIYDFTTSNGAFGTKGGNKNVRLVVESLMDHLDGSVKHYGTSYSNRLNTSYLIDGRDERKGWHTINDSWFAQSNIYYRNSKHRDIYTRKNSNTKPYAFKPASSGYNLPFGGTWDIYPGVLFMFGQMENKVWPYPNSSKPSLIADPNSNNTITVSAYGKSSPRFRVVVNGIIVGEANASSTIQNHKFTTKFPLSQIHTVIVHHDNDDNGRDLYINSITVGNQLIKANASGVKYDKFDIDGKDIINGQATMLWNGALVFKPSGSGQDNTDDDDDDEDEDEDTGLTTSIKVKAYGTKNAGVYAHFKVKINGTIIGESSTSNSYKDYTFTTAWDISDISKVSIHFDNDRNTNGQDRNLYVESITVNGTTIRSSSSGVKYDRYAEDGRDVIAGRVDMQWPGFLIFPLPSSLTNARKNFSTESIDPELPKLTDVSIAPNPSNGTFSFILELNEAANIDVAVIDMVGTTVYEKTYEDVLSRIEEKVELSNIPAGMYLLRVKANNEIVTKKIIIR